MAPHDSIQTNVSDDSSPMTTPSAAHKEDQSESQSLSPKSNDETSPLKMQRRHYGCWKRQILWQMRQLVNLISAQNDNLKHNSYHRWAVLALAFTASCILYKRPKWLVRYWTISAQPYGAGGGATSHPSQRYRLWSALSFLLGKIAASSLAMIKQPEYASAREASLTLLRTAAQQGVIQKAFMGPSRIVFSTQDGWNKTTLPSNSPTLQSDLLELLHQGGCTDVSALPESLGSKLATPLLTALPFVYLALVYRILKGLHNGSEDGGHFFLSKLLTHNGGGSNTTANSNKTKFADVAGLDDVLPEIREIAYYLQHPSNYHALGAEPPRGILLHGSPGTGKTLLARALAGEADCDAFISCTGSEFVEMYVGRGAARVRSLFQQAKQVALLNHSRKYGYDGGLFWKWLSNLRNAPHTTTEQIEAADRPPTAIIFIDELDALAKARSMGMMNSNDERDQTLNQLLTEMDGFHNSNSSMRTDPLAFVTIIVIGATNRPEALDPAILRRFDRQIYVHLPNAAGRKEILKMHAAKTNCRFSTIHWDHLSDQTQNFSGSDLKQVVNDAALLAVRQNSKWIEQGHFLQAIHRTKSTKVQRLGDGDHHVSTTPLGGRPNEPPLLHPFLWFPDGS
ncbi:ATP-dependent metallopeptidase HflB [Nitzschia inconspicua]|uniref:ATP-dependent metallopeptidase HflB n=1 Tax=Nitzschia inconspicua TaxID=303405 RepID=A0A9K3LQN6_9STRA|nr:ATP-dependent metallopeptidase HflB [Nitzschia inconspicua]